MSSADPSNPLSWIIPLVLIVLLVLFSAFFSLTEVAFTCMNQFKMKIKADDGNKSAKLALKLHEKFDKTLISVLIGHNVVAVLVSVISTLFFIWFFNLIGVGESIASIIATAVMTIIVYLFGDTIPKFIAKSNPDKIALRTAFISYCFLILFKPISLIFEGLTWLTNKILKADKKPTMTEEEFTDIVESIEEEGLLEENESDIIQNTLDFDDTTVKEVLTPVSKIVALDLHNLDNNDINNFILSTDYSRIPVYRGNINNIVGILNVKTYVREYMKDNEVNIKKILQKPYIVSNKARLEKIFDGFSKNKTHIAIVKNGDYVVGMVTMEDVLEELVGDMSEKTPKMKGVKTK